MAQMNWKSFLEGDEQLSDGSDLYVLESADDPYQYYEVITSESECDADEEEDVPDLVTDSSDEDFENLLNSDNENGNNNSSNANADANANANANNSEVRPNVEAEVEQKQMESKVKWSIDNVYQKE